MKHVFFILFSVIVLVITMIFSLNVVRKTEDLVKQKVAKERKSTMQITSSAFQDNQYIPDKYSCKGENINPPFAFSRIPNGTKSLSFIMDDPDAPMGTFVHWVIYNISPGTQGIDENSTIPASIQGQNGTGKAEYTGPCPPSGTHHYHFKLYALDSLIDDAAPLDKATLEEKMHGHIIDQTELVGLLTK